MQHPDGQHAAGRHPDEGTIHAWLDDALDAAESARVEAHVAACAACAAAVAEARGLVAAASRILGALDAVPAGVTTPGRAPAAVRAPRRAWYARPALRAAAALLVVAGGSAVVLQRSERAAPSYPASAPFATSPDLAAGAEEAMSTATPAERPTADAAPPAAPSTTAPSPAAPTSPAPPRPMTVADGRGGSDAANRAPVARDEAAPRAGRAAATLLGATGNVAGAPTPAPVPAAMAAASPALPPSAVAQSAVGAGAAAKSAGPPLAATAPAVPPRGVPVLAAPSSAARDLAQVATSAASGGSAAEARGDSAQSMQRAAEAMQRARVGSAASDVATGTMRERRASAEASPAAVALLAGCHAVALGPWTPAGATTAAALAPVVALPPRVLLDSALAPEPTAYGLALRPAPGVAAGAFRLAYWTPLAGAGARLVWRSGAATVDARVARGGDGALRGSATWAAADGRPTWRAPIELARAAAPGCGGR